MRKVLLAIADQLRSLAGSGLYFTDGPFDRERYEKLMQLAAQLAATTERESAEELEAVYRAADVGYVTPKLDVRLAVFRADQLLLVHEKADGLWAMPGGYVDIGDSPAEAAVREAVEEANVETRALRLVGVFDNRLQPESPAHLFHIHKLLFLGELLDPQAEPSPGHEVRDAGFYPIDDLPELSLGRTLPLHISEARKALANPNHPAYFDR